MWKRFCFSDGKLDLNGKLSKFRQCKQTAFAQILHFLLFFKKIGKHCLQTFKEHSEHFDKDWDESDLKQIAQDFNMDSERICWASGVYSALHLQKYWVWQ